MPSSPHRHTSGHALTPIDISPRDTASASTVAYGSVSTAATTPGLPGSALTAAAPGANAPHRGSGVSFQNYADSPHSAPRGAFAAVAGPPTPPSRRSRPSTPSSDRCPPPPPPLLCHPRPTSSSRDSTPLSCATPTAGLPPLQAPHGGQQPTRLADHAAAKRRVEASTTAAETFAPKPVRRATRRPCELSLSTNTAPSPSATARGSCPVACDGSPSGSGIFHLASCTTTHNSSLRTNRTLSMVARDSSMLSYCSGCGEAPEKAATTTVTANEEHSSSSSAPLSAGGVAGSFECATGGSTASSRPPLLRAAPGATGMSKCRRKLQGITTPAFDMQKVEEISQRAFQGFCSDTIQISGGESGNSDADGDSAGNTASGSVRAQRLGGSGLLRIHLPGAEGCYYDEDICNAAECHPISRVNDFIYLGTWRDANSPETLEQHRITFVLNCAREVDHCEENGSHEDIQFNFDLEHYDDSLLHDPARARAVLPTSQPGTKLVSASIPMQDCHKEDLETKLGAAFFFIMLARQQGANVLVHCRRGISRSAALVVAFLMAVRGTAFEETYEDVSARRSCVSLNLAFREYLDERFHPDPKWAALMAQMESGRATATNSSSAPWRSAGSRTEEDMGRASCSSSSSSDQGDEEPYSPFHKPARGGFGDCSTTTSSSTSSSSSTGSGSGEADAHSPQTSPGAEEEEYVELGELTPPSHQCVGGLLRSSGPSGGSRGIASFTARPGSVVEAEGTRKGGPSEAVCSTASSTAGGTYTPHPHSHCGRDSEVSFSSAVTALHNNNANGNGDAASVPRRRRGLRPSLSLQLAEDHKDTKGDFTVQ